MSETPQFKNLVDLCSKSVQRFAGNAIFGNRQPDGTWTYITYREFGQLVDRCRGGLKGLGVEAGDRVAIIANNRVEWAVTAYATYGVGACIVPMYEKQNPADWGYILRDSQAKVLVVANDKVAQEGADEFAKIDTLKHIVVMDGAGEGTFAALLEAGAANPTPPADPEPGDLCGFIYTSGTTGNPKGVRLSHGNITSNVNAVQAIFPMAEDDRSLSFLPWAHSFGQTVELHCGFSFGASMAICPDANRLTEFLPEVRPTLLFSVPRVFNRIYDKLNKRIAHETGVKKFLMTRALAVAAEKKRLEAQGTSSWWIDTQFGFLDKKVLSKIREILGGRLRYAFSGGAAISKEVATFIDALGITVYEGYGLSETSPIATANYPGHQRIGSVGKAIPGVEIIIDTAAVAGAMGDQGEILIKGPNIMQGYHNLDEQTAEVMREDGAFRSGDLGRLDADGYLYITGRIKEQYKLENGKYVVPAPLEEQLKLSGYINQALVFGDNRPFNVALLVPDVEALTDWAKEHGRSGGLEDWLEDDAVKALFRAEIDRTQKDLFKGFERIKDFRFVAEEFTTDNDMMTPTLKLKRRNVLKAYQGLIDSIYDGLSAAS
jgi:long-chain acyl-CoA synthetase